MKPTVHEHPKNNTKTSSKTFAIVLTILLVYILTASCGIFGSLNSNTLIKPKDSFILGNNEHGSFKVKLTNVSENEIKIYKAPINGGTHSPQIISPHEIIIIKVDKNTALIIENKFDETASVNLKITGDLGLSMGYKN